MPSPSSQKPRSPRTPSSQQRTPPRNAVPPRGAPQEFPLVDPGWLFKALAIVLVFALACAYGTLCLLYNQGQWQIVLHPSRTVTATSASLPLGFDSLHFGDDGSGQPQLDGWWVPADLPNAPTALLLHGADGSIANTLPQVLTLHNAHLNVLVFDYRGYGRSAGQHPTEDSMQTDAASALSWLIATHHVPAQQVVLVGSGIGASLAVRLAAQHPDIPAIILEAADGDLAERAWSDARSRLVPARWLFDQTFPLADALHTLATPKLLISYTSVSQPPVALQRAADPKVTLELPSPTDPALVPAIDRFVDLYLHALLPAPSPTP